MGIVKLIMSNVLIEDKLNEIINNVNDCNDFYQFLDIFLHKYSINNYTKNIIH